MTAVEELRARAELARSPKRFAALSSKERLRVFNVARCLETVARMRFQARLISPDAPALAQLLEQQAEILATAVLISKDGSEALPPLDQSTT